MNQKGFAAPMIVIIAGVIIALGFLVTLWKFNSGSTPSPTPQANNPDCINKDYTGCDSLNENFNWTDDGKR